MAAFDSSFDSSFDIDDDEWPSVESDLSVSTAGGKLTAGHTDGSTDP